MNEPKVAGPSELAVLIAAGAHEPERLLLLGIPAGGRVHVREWSSGAAAGEAVERDWSVDDVYAECRRAYDARRRLSVGLPEIRAWLDGRPR